MNKEDLEELLFHTEEDLSPELAEYVDDSGPFGNSIKHPLVYSIMHAPQQNAFVNRQLQYKKDALAKAEAEGAWGTYVWLHERPYRIDAFMEIEERMDDDEYWTLLGHIWTDSENIWQNEEDWTELMESGRGDRSKLMDDEEREYLAGLPDELVIWRGFKNDDRELGLSWTLDRSRAKWFAKRLSSDNDVARVASGKVKKSDVIAFFGGRNEEEIVINPCYIQELTIEHVEDMD
jgi:hypothetical protein